MFYEEDTIKRTLNCKQCNQRLDEPRILPCGSTICSACTKSIQLDEKRYYKCSICNKKHSYPQEGLPISESLSQLLTHKPKEVYRSKVVESLKSSLKEIEENIKQISLSLNGLDQAKEMEQTKEYLVGLRNEVKMATEQAIKQLNEISDEFIDEIDHMEKAWIALNVLNEKTKQELRSAVTQSELFLNEWNKYLKQPVINDESVLNANQAANNLLNDTKRFLSEIERINFNGGRLKFVKNQAKLKKSSLGSFTVDFQSSILSNQQMIELLSLCGFSWSKSWKLLYRASRDGFAGNDFHSNCDNKPNTFIIIKSANENVFGGYTEQNWSYTDSGEYKTDPAAFLFSYINKEKKPLVMKCQEPEKAIFCFGKNGPIFGGVFGKRDLALSMNSNENHKSYSNLGSSFKHPVYMQGSKEAQSFLAGCSNFQTIEIEVYTYL
jgi:hypothetical protein